MAFDGIFHVSESEMEDAATIEALRDALREALGLIADNRNMLKEFSGMREVERIELLGKAALDPVRR